MKSLLLTGLAAALVLPAVAAPAIAKDNRADNHGRQVSRVATHHQFKRGEKFDRRKASNYQEINYRSNKRLKAPPRGYHWVRSGNDALLVAISSGVISSIVAGMYR
jgi:Ni/Co efflux regulator RcnB